MLNALLLGVPMAAAFGLAFGLTFMRSSQLWPRNWRQWRSELEWQVMGFVALIEDHVLRRNNRTKLIRQPAGRVAVITGGNRGIGLCVVVQLLQCGYTVIMGVRNVDQTRRAIEEACEQHRRTGDDGDLEPPSPDRVQYERLDIGSMSSVRQFADRVTAKHARIDLLINNAGIMATPYALTADGYEEQLAVNYLGHFLLTHLLMGALRAAGTPQQRARIVNVSSCVHRLGVIRFDDLHGKTYTYPPDAYNQSKLAQVMFTKHLQAELNERGLDVQTHAVHPGVVDTGLFVNTTSSQIPWFKRLFFKTPDQGARTIVHAALAPKLEGQGGTYVSNCTVMRTHGAVKDAPQCARLFAESSRMLGIEGFFDA